MKTYTVWYEVDRRWKRKGFDDPDKARAFVKKNLALRGTDEDHRVKSFWNAWYVTNPNILDSGAFMRGDNTTHGIPETEA